MPAFVFGPPLHVLVVHAVVVLFAVSTAPVRFTRHDEPTATRVVRPSRSSSPRPG